MSGLFDDLSSETSARPYQDAVHGKRVVAHPSRVTQAYQIAAKERIGSVQLREHVPPTHVYVLDLDELAKLPEEGFPRV